jgi:hypothetical protein
MPRKPLAPILRIKRSIGLPPKRIDDWTPPKIPKAGAFNVQTRLEQLKDPWKLNNRDMFFINAIPGRIYVLLSLSFIDQDLDNMVAIVQPIGKLNSSKQLLLTPNTKVTRIHIEIV